MENQFPQSEVLQYTFIEAEELIRSTFDSIMNVVTKRRDQLLIQLNNMRLEYLNKEVTRHKHLKELEKIITQLCETSIKQNEIVNFNEEQKTRTQRESQKYEQPTPIPIISISTDDLEFLLQQLKTFGSVEALDSLYRHKINPVSSFGKFGSMEGQFDFPHDITLYKENVYITDTGNRRIQIFSSVGKFIKEFGKEHFVKPYSIAITDQWVFVSDSCLKAVLKFQRPTNKFVRQSIDGELGCPFGLTADTNGELLVADSVSNIVVVMSSDLELIRSIGINILKQPCNVKIHKNKIFVADKNELKSIHVFTKSGDILKSIIQLSSGSGVIFMCFDSYNNILINDFIDNSIRIFTIDGQLIHKIECTNFPTGIAINKDFNILCASLDGVLYIY